jgi:hypothetical protein
MDSVCDVITAAASKSGDTAAPSGTRLPVEPVEPIPLDALERAASRRGGSLSPYTASSSSFDVAFITPVIAYAARQRGALNGPPGARGARTFDAEPASVRQVKDFGSWSEYVESYPRVLLVRVTPRLVEGFWTTVARGAAMTQGVAVPAIKHFKPGFLRMRAFCGSTEVTPIHPFRIEQPVSDTDAIFEGLYAFDPGALGPHCAGVRLALHSEKEPAKSETITVDPKLVQQAFQDFDAFRRVQ